MRIAMIGTGYIGLVSGACFADFGHHVTCIDKDIGKIAALERSEITIFESGSTGWSRPTPPPGGFVSPPT
jgi:UDPglucose 6-dehydrogenase